MGSPLGRPLLDSHRIGSVFYQTHDHVLDLVQGNV